MQNIKPDLEYQIRPGVKILVFGSNNKNTNWKCLIKPDLPCDEENKREMVQTVIKFGGDKILAPNSSLFNAVVTDPKNLQTEINIDGLTILRGCDAEGVLVPKGMTAGFFPADCYTVVAYDSRDNVIACHAGGKSTFDSEATALEKTTRENESVANAIIRKFQSLGSRIEEISAFICFGIDWQHFGYDGKTDDRFLKRIAQVSGQDSLKKNHRTGVRDRYDIRQALRNQFRILGVEPKKISTDSVDTFSNNKFWSHERSKRESNESEALNGRNLVLVVHA